MTNKIVRVATTNNFNCTKKEWKQLDNYTKLYPDNNFFVNCNIKTPRLKTVLEHSYKVVVTANPDIYPADLTSILSKLEIIKSHIAFIRVKYIPNNPEILTLIRALTDKCIPVVLTLQRFNSKATLKPYACLNDYKWTHQRYRLQGEALKYIEDLVDTVSKNSPIWICDRAGKGCTDCKLCSTLTSQKDLLIASLNLSSSGVCSYDCPDCYAKTMQNFVVACGHRPIRFDVIQQNAKQSGKTKHIKDAIKKKA